MVEGWRRVAKGEASRPEGWKNRESKAKARSFGDPGGCKAYVFPLLVRLLGYPPPAGQHQHQHQRRARREFPLSPAPLQPQSQGQQQQQQQQPAAAATQQLSPLQKKSTFINLPADICAHNFRDPAIKEPLLRSSAPPPNPPLPPRQAAPTTLIASP